MKTGININKSKINIKYTIILFCIVIFYTILNRGGYTVTGLSVLVLAAVLSMFKKYKDGIRLDIVSAFLLLIFGISVISGVFFSIDAFSAVKESSKYLLFAMSYIFYRNSKDTDKIEKIFFAGIIFIMLFGFCGYTGLDLFAQMVTQKGQRLQSFLQYANTTALFMGIGALLSADKYMKNKQKRYIVIGLLFIVSLLFTKSRTTLVLFILIFSVYMCCMLKGRNRKIFIAVIVSAVVVLMLTDMRITHISLTEPTFIERIITYCDGTKMIFKGIFGLGLGNWQFLQFENQTAPYKVMYIHNFFLQIGLDCGIIGLLMFIGVTVYFLYKNFRFRNVYYYIAVLMLMHSFFEVDFNFGLVIVFYTFVLVCVNPDNLLKEYSFKPNRAVKCIYSGVGIIIIVFTLCLNYSQYLSVKGDKNAKLDSYKASLVYKRANKFNPWDTELLLKLAKVEPNPKTAVRYLEMCVERNPYYFEAYGTLTERYIYKKDYDNAIAAAENLFNIFPYSKKNQQLLMSVIEDAYKTDYLNGKEFIQLRKKYSEIVKTKNENINPLYKYINENMDY